MGLSNQTELFDPVRKIWVTATPEEKVRQNLLKWMMESLGYPKEFLSIEKDLNTFPHVKVEGKSFPERRLDIVCFAKDIHPLYPLYPLLVIECKQTRLTQKVIDQVVGYNYHLKAHFIAIANHEEIRVGYLNHQTNQYQFTQHLPTYRELLNVVSV